MAIREGCNCCDSLTTVYSLYNITKFIGHIDYIYQPFRAPQFPSSIYCHPYVMWTSNLVYKCNIQVSTLDSPICHRGNHSRAYIMRYAGHLSSLSPSLNTYILSGVWQRLSLRKDTKRTHAMMRLELVLTM
jgi:hypothetical protein